jgi:transcriptional regulator with XRE-family HTH domain
MPLPVIPALFRELSEERRRSGLSQEELAERTGYSTRTIERWEQLKNLPMKPGKNPEDPGGGLAKAVDAYAAISPRSPFELWTAAVKRAEDNRTDYEEWLASNDPTKPNPFLDREPSPDSQQVVDEIRRQKKP